MFFLFTNLVLGISLKLALCSYYRAKRINSAATPFEESIGNPKFYIDEQTCAIESKNDHGIESDISIFRENTCDCMQFVVMENSITTDSFECVT